MKTEEKETYRIGFRSLRVNINKDKAFVTKNFLIIISRKLNPTNVFEFSGKEYPHFETYDLPIEQKNIEIKIKKKEYPIDSYLELYVFSEQDNLIQRHLEGEYKSKPILGLINLCLDKRALDKKIIEDCQNITMIYDEKEISLKDKKPMNITFTVGSVSPEIRPLESIPLIDIYSNNYETLNSYIQKYVNLCDDIKNRLNTSLRWYYKAVNENIIEDKFLSFWISFETISMKGSTNVTIAKKNLCKILKIDINQVNDCLEIGRMYGLRCDLVHGKKFSLDKIQNYSNKLQEIIEEYLRYILGVNLQGTLHKYLRA